MIIQNQSYSQQNKQKPILPINKIICKSEDQTNNTHNVSIYTNKIMITIKNNTSNDIVEHLPNQEISNDHDNNNNSNNNVSNEKMTHLCLHILKNVFYPPRNNQLINYLVT